MWNNRVDVLKVTLAPSSEALSFRRREEKRRGGEKMAERCHMQNDIQDGGRRT